jgi:hypothetical protein
MITTAEKTFHEALKNKDYETLAQLYVERQGKADLAEVVKWIREFIDFSATIENLVGGEKVLQYILVGDSLYL